MIDRPHAMRSSRIARLIGIVLLLLPLFAVSTAFAQMQAAAVAGLSATATHKAITITQNDDWNFGFIFTGSTAGSVILATNGTRTATGGVVLFNTTTSTPHAASYTITGDASAAYSLMFPSSITLTQVGGTQTMSLTNFTKTGSGVLTNGTETIAVGATLNVGALQTGGNYSGTNYVIAVYN